MSYTEEEMKEIFHTFDKDQSGAIDIKELREVMNLLGQNPTPADLQEMIESLDKNENGTIEFSEFKTLFDEFGKEMEEEKEALKASFKLFDKDGSGFIDRHEISETLTKVGEKPTMEECDEIFNLADKNGDGKISYDEFVEMLLA